MNFRRFLPAAVLLLTSCAGLSTADPAEVLQKSVLANQNLQSARFVLDADYASYLFVTDEQTEGTVHVEGAMQLGGRQLDLHITADGTSTDDDEASWSLDANIIVADEDEIYVQVSDLTFDPAPLFFAGVDIGALLGTWWQLPSSEETVSAEISPDPGYLRMQIETINVVNDKGIVSIGGRRTHHYEVAVDPQKLSAFLQTLPESDMEQHDLENLTATGEIWIDTETFALRRARWHIVSTDPEEPSDVTLVIDITDHNTTIEISPPSPSLPFPTSSLFPSLP